MKLVGFKCEFETVEHCWSSGKFAGLCRNDCRRLVSGLGSIYPVYMPNWTDLFVSSDRLVVFLTKYKRNGKSWYCFYRSRIGWQRFYPWCDKVSVPRRSSSQRMNVPTPLGFSIVTSATHTANTHGTSKILHFAMKRRNEHAVGLGRGYLRTACVSQSLRSDWRWWERRALWPFHRLAPMRVDWYILIKSSLMCVLMREIDN